jgi:lysine biosynthesis protein LysW
MALVTCIECDEELELAGRPRLGQMLICTSCRARLEVVSTNPLEVDWAEDEDEEWEDDFDDESFEDDFADDDNVAYDDDFENDDIDDDIDDEADRNWR